MGKRIAIGDEHEIEFVTYRDDDRVGINVFHKTPDGKDCSGWVPFKGKSWEAQFAGSIQSWDVTKSRLAG